MSTGLQLGLDEVFGLDVRPLALTEALYLLMSDASSNRRWPAGEELHHDTDVTGIRLRKPSEPQRRVAVKSLNV